MHDCSRSLGTGRRPALLAIAAALGLLAAVACGGDAVDDASSVDDGASRTSGAAPTTDAAPEPSVAVGHAVGQRAPDFTVETIGGEAFTLSEATGAGSPVLLYFFTTW